MSLLSNKSEVREFALPLQVALIIFGVGWLIFGTLVYFAFRRRHGDQRDQERESSTHTNHPDVSVRRALRLRL